MTEEGWPGVQGHAPIACSYLPLSPLAYLQ